MSLTSPASQDAALAVPTQVAKRPRPAEAAASTPDVANRRPVKEETSSILSKWLDRPPAQAATPKRKRRAVEPEASSRTKADVDAPPAQMDEDHSGASEAASSSASASSSSSEEEPGDAPVSPQILKLFKLGEFCCEVQANFAEGNQQPEQLPESLQIDQRANLDRCRQHLDLSRERGTFWMLKVIDKQEREAYDALCDYFIRKKRVGLVESEVYDIYIVPPEESFLKELGLADSKYLVALQVPAVDG